MNHSRVESPTHLLFRFRKNGVDVYIAVHCVQIDSHVGIAGAENVLLRERFAGDDADANLTRSLAILEETKRGCLR